MTGHCGNCGTRLHECNREGCSRRLDGLPQVVCLPMPASDGYIYRHFCSMAHLFDWMKNWRDEHAYIAAVTGAGGVAVHE